MSQSAVPETARAMHAYIKRIREERKALAIASPNAEANYCTLGRIVWGDMQLVWPPGGHPDTADLCSGTNPPSSAFLVASYVSGPHEERSWPSSVTRRSMCRSRYFARRLISRRTDLALRFYRRRSLQVQHGDGVDREHAASA